jgi:cation:H+ antiporter
MKKRPLLAIGTVVALTIPWIVIQLTEYSHSLSVGAIVVVSGLSIVGASFLLTWAAETAEKDVPQAFAIAVLAVLAVAPEYAVDALYAWQAGIDPGPSEAASLAVANMTGANRILIGIGWSGIALFTIYRAKRSGDPVVNQRSGFLRDAVELDPQIATEITFLFAATIYAFFVPLGGKIGMVDTVLLVGLYVLYIAIIIRGDVDETEKTVGVPAYFQSYPKPRRITVVIFLFTFSGVMIYSAVHPFAHGLEELGKGLGVPSFFMIQWIAPLASESPELIVVAYLVNKARSTAGFNALISSKLNQWTLLIGTLAVVYSIAAGHVGGLPLEQKQIGEIWITAAQSFFALAILSDFKITTREAVVLFVLFISQVLAEFYVIQIYTDPAQTNLNLLILYAYTALYVVLGVLLFVKHRGNLRELLERTASNARNAMGSGTSPPSAD